MELSRDQHKQGAPSLLDTINEEIEQSRDQEHNWRSTVNEKNYSSLRQVELMWKKAERFVHAFRDASLPGGIENRCLRLFALPTERCRTKGLWESKGAEGRHAKLMNANFSC